MLKQFEELRNEIRDIRQKNQSETIAKCKQYLKLVNQVQDLDVNEDKWFIYHNLGRSNKILGNMETALKYALMAVNYTNRDSKDFNYHYFYSTWLIALCFAHKGIKKEALELYTECYVFYRKIGDEQQKACTISNKAKLLKKSKVIKKVIKIYESKNLKSVIETHGDLKYDEVLKELYSDLFDLYILEDKQKCFEVLYIIKDKKLKKELGRRLRVA